MSTEHNTECWETVKHDLKDQAVPVVCWKYWRPCYGIYVISTVHQVLTWSAYRLLQSFIKNYNYQPCSFAKTASIVYITHNNLNQSEISLQNAYVWFVIKGGVSNVSSRVQQQCHGMQYYSTFYVDKLFLFKTITSCSILSI